MGPVHDLEHTRVEGLDAQSQPIGTEFAENLQALQSDITNQCGRVNVPIELLDFRHIESLGEKL